MPMIKIPIKKFLNLRAGHVSQKPFSINILGNIHHMLYFAEDRAIQSIELYSSTSPRDVVLI